MLIVGAGSASGGGTKVSFFFKLCPPNSSAASEFLIFRMLAYREIRSLPFSPVAKSAHFPVVRFTFRLSPASPLKDAQVHSLPTNLPPGSQLDTSVDPFDKAARAINSKSIFNVMIKPLILLFFRRSN